MDVLNVMNNYHVYNVILILYSIVVNVIVEINK